MPFTIDSARSIFPNTLTADTVPATIARFKQLSAEDQLALIWFAYLEMGKTITIAAPGAANMQFAETTLSQIKQMSFQEQSQVMCDLTNRADTPIQFDRGSFHTIKTLDCPENIIPIFQSPHSPELNPIERFWEFLKSKLEWENCKTLDQLRKKLAEVLETITPEVIASLTSYNFILEALFSAAS